MDLVVHFMHVTAESMLKFVSEVTFTFEAHLSSTWKLLSNVELKVLGWHPFAVLCHAALIRK